MTDDRAPRRFSCARASRDRGEPLWATASCVRRWVLVEQTGSWGRDAVVDSGLPERVAHALKDRARQADARVLLIRRSGRYVPARPACLVAVSDHETPWVERLEVDDVTDLPDVDFTPLREGASLGGRRVTDPVFLVCTNGAHDTCCAEYGRPLARALGASHGEQVWECSHFGGDRFAGNLVALPHGYYFGRVAPADGPRIATAYAAGRLDLAHCRGRSSYPFPVQAAEHFARARTGLDGVDDLRLFRRGTLPDGRVRAAFETGDGRRLTAVVAAGVRTAQRLTCRADEPHPAPAYRLEGLEVSGADSGTHDPRHYGRHDEGSAMTAESTSPMLEAARGQRAGLHATMVELERTIAAPASGREGEWAERVHDALVDLAAAFERHIAVTEGPEGLLNDVVRTAPRLANAARHLGEEHEGIRRMISDSLTMVRRVTRSPGAEGASHAREELLSLILRLSRHRQRGADLIFEAYAVDVGGGD